MTSADKDVFGVLAVFGMLLVVKDGDVDVDGSDWSRTCCGSLAAAMETAGNVLVAVAVAGDGVVAAAVAGDGIVAVAVAGGDVEVLSMCMPLFHACIFHVMYIRVGFNVYCI